MTARPNKFQLASIPLLLASIVLFFLPLDGHADELDKDRYALSETSDGVLRLDRESGRVSECKQIDGSWRCVPVPDAELAFEMEIETLAKENARLLARNQELEAKILAIGRSAEEAMSDLNGKTLAPKTEAPKSEERVEGLSTEDEKQIDRALDFTEKAMRRFFGLMRTLREEFDNQQP